jgi:FkbM family methyltransferase
VKLWTELRQRTRKLRQQLYRPRQQLRKLRPRKIRNAVQRRWFEHRLERTALTPAPEVTQLGSAYGGWMIPTGLLGQAWLCYCVGVGGDISFDLELIKRYAASVRAFDPVADYVDGALAQAGGEPLFSVHQAAIATRDGPLRVQVTHDHSSRSVSAAQLYESDVFLELPGRTLGSLMDELGDHQIDLLKLDIEGAEYEVMPTLDLRALGVKVFAIQLHHTGSVRAARALIARLREQGYEPVGCKPAVKLTFARTDLLAR